MQYIVVIYEAEAELDKRLTPQTFESYMAPYQSYVAALRQEGVLVGGEMLQRPDTATTIRFESGQRSIEDGPVAHSHEQLGGFLVIEVPDLDAALAVAERCPAARNGGAVEVRPVATASPA